jgi:ATP-dependent DNA helicase RecQ
VSPFVAEATGKTPPRAKGAPAAKTVVPSGDPLFERLRRWRRDRAATDGVPPYVVFHDKTLAAIAAAKPSTPGALREIAGVGPTKVERYGDELLSVLDPAHAG